MSVDPPSIRVAKESYKFILYPKTEKEITDIDQLDPASVEEARAGNIINEKKPLISPGLSENSDNFARVAGMRGPQLRYFIRDSYIISKYYPVSECEKQRLKLKSV